MPSGEISKEKVEQYRRKLERCMACVQLLKNFDNFVDQDRWDAQFDVSLDMYLEQVASVNMRLFMGMPKPTDLIQNKGKNKASVVPQDDSNKL